MIGGFKSPLFILGISAAAATTQGGFVTPIPVLNMGATQAITQGGFITPIPVLSIGANGSAEPLPDVLPPGSGSQRKQGGYKLSAAQISQIQREDEELITIINIIGEHL